MAVNAAMSDDPRAALGRILNPPQPLREEDLPPMLRIPKDKTKKGKRRPGASPTKKVSKRSRGEPH